MKHYLLEARLLKIDWKVGEALPWRLAKCETVPKRGKEQRRSCAAWCEQEKSRWKRKTWVGRVFWI